MITFEEEGYPHLPKEHLKLQKALQAAQAELSFLEGLAMLEQQMSPGSIDLQGRVREAFLGLRANLTAALAASLFAERDWLTYLAQNSPADDP